MNNIELIIKYLSGEMLPEESTKFMKEISGNADLQSEFESLSLIWKEIKEQLALEDGPEALDRETLIAEVIAEHDLQFYKQEPESKEEMEYRKKMEELLRDAENEEVSDTKKRRFTPKSLSLISIAAAAAIIAFVLLVNPPSDLYELSEKYYQPGSDDVFESISGTSRSGIGSAVTLFRQGDFEKAQSLSFSEMHKYPELGEIRLLYALSCYGSGDFKAAEANLNAIDQQYKGDLNETARWYLALIKIRSEQEQEAKPLLEDLMAEGSEYKKQAEKLLKKINKLED